MEISEIRTAAPAEGRAAVELETFALLDRLHIPYAWVAHETADTIADCDVVSEVLGISICKNLFLCNRQKTAFYLLTMPGGKPFQTKVLSAQLGTTR
ncbi:MAG: prolyl-tRNA synthetase associated domain-containing protein, partial [Dysosmobacter sp.]|nr:prolyl-tRNA synthetase associated domain-containing protein [Dysosmobacter sp.]